ncbi:MAG: hypothetical protein ACYTXE_33935 [Nostoc sp.]
MLTGSKRSPDNSSLKLLWLLNFQSQTANKITSSNWVPAASPALRCLRRAQPSLQTTSVVIGNWALGIGGLDWQLRCRTTAASPRLSRSRW